MRLAVSLVLLAASATVAAAQSPRPSSSPAAFLRRPRGWPK